MDIRVGIGYDIHRFGDGRRLILGGVHLPGAKGLEGHSDADVLTHAVLDALLGAASLGDIGTHFPPEDDRFAGADSLELLRYGLALMSDQRWRVLNVDATLIAERPRLGPHVHRMSATIAGVLGVDPQRVSIKAKTNEGMGALGSGEGIAAMAVALVGRDE